MKQSRQNLALSALTMLAMCAGGVTFAMASNSNPPDPSSVPLRQEIALQYGQSKGTLVSINGGTDVCVPWASLGGMPTGNAGDGLLHCHSYLLNPMSLEVGFNNGKLDVPITAVGNLKVKMSGIVDTGSGGVELNALQIFPSDKVNSGGFQFKSGQTKIVYHGMIVTRLTAVRNYGAESNGTSRTGNLGFAQVTFGANGQVKTAMIPVLFVYQDTGATLSAKSGDTANTIGINDTTDVIGQQISFDDQPFQTADASTTPYPLCTPETQTFCSVISPFRALSYRPGLQAGYVLSRFPLADASPGNYLTVGIDQNNTQGFASAQLNCVTSSIQIQSCNQAVKNVQVNVTGQSTFSFVWSVIFDSGRPTAGLESPLPIPASTSTTDTLPAGDVVTVALPNQASYTYSYTTTSTGNAKTAINEVPSGSTQSQIFSNVGIEFFDKNSLMLDYDKGIEGWKTASSN
jgi:hypothetical protein